MYRCFRRRRRRQRHRGGQFTLVETAPMVGGPVAARSHRDRLGTAVFAAQASPPLSEMRGRDGIGDEDRARRCDGHDPPCLQIPARAAEQSAATSRAEPPRAGAAHGHGTVERAVAGAEHGRCATRCPLPRPGAQGVDKGPRRTARQPGHRNGAESNPTYSSSPSCAKTVDARGRGPRPGGQRRAPGFA